MRVGFFVNGTSFHAGKMMIGYRPLSKGDITAAAVEAGYPQTLITLSQRHGCYLSPTDTSGVMLDLPFVWPNSALRIPQKEWQNMGVIDLVTLNELVNSNDSTEPLTITVWANADNVVLSQPTTHTFTPGVEEQAGDPNMPESRGTISGPATAVSNVLRRLTWVPTFGSYAKIGSALADSVGAIARVFGHSRPLPQQTTIVTQRDNYALGIAYANSTAVPTSLDPKKGVTADPATVGLGPEDQMAFGHIVKKESFLKTFPWSPDTPVGTPLFSVAVTPSLFDFGQTYHPTPMMGVALLHEYWHGTIHFRMDIVKTKFQNGRIRLVYDSISAETNETNVNRSLIVDLAEETGATFSVGWGSPQLFLKTQGLSANLPFATGASLAANPDFWNGTVTAYVETELTVAGQTPVPASINIFACMGDDAQFALPTQQKIAGLSYRQLFDSVLHYPQVNIPPQVALFTTEYSIVPFNDNTLQSYAGPTSDTIEWRRNATTSPPWSDGNLVRLEVPVDVAPNANGPLYVDVGYVIETDTPLSVTIQSYGDNNLIETVTQTIPAGKTGATNFRFTAFGSQVPTGIMSVRLALREEFKVLKCTYVRTPLNPNIRYQKFDSGDLAWDPDSNSNLTDKGWVVNEGGVDLRLNLPFKLASTYPGSFTIGNSAPGGIDVNGTYTVNGAVIANPPYIVTRLLNNLLAGTQQIELTRSGVPGINGMPVKCAWVPLLLDEPAVVEEAGDPNESTRHTDGGESGEHAPQSVEYRVTNELEVERANQICVGESVASLRALLKRYVRMYSILQTASTNTYNLFTTRPRSNEVGELTPFDFTRFWYLGYRGSMNYLVTGTLGDNGARNVHVSGGLVAAHNGCNFSGSAPVGDQPFSEFNVPYYSNTRFALTRADTLTFPYDIRHKGELFVQKVGDAGNIIGVDTSIGEDFSFFWFQGIPPITL